MKRNIMISLLPVTLTTMAAMGMMTVLILYLILGQGWFLMLSI
jgi:hypothetical protein